MTFGKARTEPPPLCRSMSRILILLMRSTSTVNRRANDSEVTVSALRTESVREMLVAFCVFVAAACVFGILFNRETALSYSIGYNLYGAERILNGEVPYRDFHTLYPPATVYLNAAIFKLFGVRLYTALFGVFVFKALTTAAIYLSGRQVMPRLWAIVGAVYSVVWLRPNGPFKAVPMHYGALLLAVALYWILRFQRTGRIYCVVAAGLSLGALALFKHNIGAYAVLGFAAWLLLDRRRAMTPACSEDSKASADRAGSARLKELGAMFLGFAAPILPVLAYLRAKGALGAMVRTLLFGPGEFLLSRLAGAPSLRGLALGLLAVGGLAGALYALRVSGSLARLIGAGVSVAGAIFCVAASEPLISEVLFYQPVIIILVAIAALAVTARLDGYARPVGPLVVAAGAAFTEGFPRFAREQAIAAMPFVGLLLIYLVYGLWRTIAPRIVNPGWSLGVVLAALPLAFLLLGVRFFHQTYFRGLLSVRSDTELGIERGRGVLFPSETAREIDEVARYVQERVPEGGYVFPQSYAGSSFLFLANRINPSGAQFWGGVGVSAAERALTLAALEEKRVGLIITSAKDVEAEKYAPMRDYIANNFRKTAQFGDVLILERAGRMTLAVVARSR